MKDTSLRGFLYYSNNSWSYHVGRSSRTLRPHPTLLLNTNIHVLISDHKIVLGWKTTKHMLDLRSLLQMETITIHRMRLTGSSDMSCLTSSSIRQLLLVSPPIECIANKRAHIKASSLSSPAPPTSLKSHHNLSPHDHSIWDRDYLQEYLSLNDNTNTWE